ncbi:uncharacterized protein F5147DRAFT_85121 [Suillus discolor]|uniref:Transmembrane protein n=1 Tax=Suillus discolor TaxID=1912936 RepID=A0A9P7JW75_9AGAM|nr:uncharacterized protein F5147DRAFT_85121 [Suillus discolor]KAG2111958.1 hypothetical protein F5147DRAFT_85121 [Suillus discolor]
MSTGKPPYRHRDRLCDLRVRAGSVVTLRVCYLSPRSCFIRWLVVSVLVIYTTGTTRARSRHTCIYMYLLPLVVHSTMFLLKLYRFHDSEFQFALSSRKFVDKRTLTFIDRQNTSPAPPSHRIEA